MEHDPVVAWGMKALTLCMKAKGNKVSLTDAETLIADAQRLLPEDERAAEAAGAFAGVVVSDSVAAGDALQDFLIHWRRGVMQQPTDRTEEALRDMNPDHFDWQSRKDCGHD